MNYNQLLTGPLYSYIWLLIKNGPEGILSPSSYTKTHQEIARHNRLSNSPLPTSKNKPQALTFHSVKLTSTYCFPVYSHHANSTSQQVRVGKRRKLTEYGRAPTLNILLTHLSTRRAPTLKILLTHPLHQNQLVIGKAEASSDSRTHQGLLYGGFLIFLPDSRLFIPQLLYLVTTTRFFEKPKMEISQTEASKQVKVYKNPQSYLLQTRL